MHCAPWGNPSIEARINSQRSPSYPRNSISAMESASRRVDLSWYCCSCGDGPMTTRYSVTCSGLMCGHQKCEACSVEVIPHKKSRLGKRGRKRRGLNASTGDAALLNNGSDCGEPGVKQPTSIPSNGVHATSEGLAEPHPAGVTGPHLRALWPAEPQICRLTQACPPRNFHFPVPADSSILPSFPPDLSLTSYQSYPTSAWEHQPPLSNPTIGYPTGLDQLTTEPTWPDDPQLLQLLDLNSTYCQQDVFVPAIDRPQPSGLVTATAVQSQPPQQKRLKGSEPAHPHKRSENRKDEPGRLACPFWKKNLRRAWSESGPCCGRYKRIRDVKQHLYRHHTDQSHAKRTGKMKDTGSMEKLTESQIDKVGRYSKRNSGDIAQWYAIWDVLFPKLPRPASPYINQDLKAELDEFSNSPLGQGISMAFAESYERVESASPTAFSQDTPYTPAFSPVPMISTIPESPGVAVSDLLYGIDDALSPQNFGSWCNYIGGYAEVYQGNQQMYQHLEIDEDGDDLDELIRGCGPPR